MNRVKYDKRYDRYFVLFFDGSRGWLSQRAVDNAWPDRDWAIVKTKNEQWFYIQEDENMYVYIKSEPNLFTVGFYKPDGSWEPEHDYPDREEAAKRVAWLNGSKQIFLLPPGGYANKLPAFFRTYFAWVTAVTIMSFVLC